MFTTLIFFIQAVSLCKKGKRKGNILPVFLSDLNTMCRRGALNEIVSRTGREISKKVVDPFTFEFIFQSHKALSIPSMFGIEDTSKSKNKYCKNFENIIRQEIYIMETFATVELNFSIASGRLGINLNSPGKLS